MTIRCANRLELHRIIAWRRALILLAFVSCNYEIRQTAGKSADIFQLSTPPDATFTQALTCGPRGQFVPCFCKDGSQSGTQFCNELGRLGPCMYCRGEAITVSGDSICPQVTARSTCSAKSYQSSFIPANILFVIDRSATMACNAPPTQTSECVNAPSDPKQPSKWAITVEALLDVLPTLNRGQGVRVGLMFFSNDTECGVNSPLSFGDSSLSLVNASKVALLTDILKKFEPAELYGKTPLVGATISAYRYLYEEAGIAPGETACASPPCGAGPGNRFVVLITDGEDSCPDPVPTDDVPVVPCGASGPSPLIACTDYLLEYKVTEALNANIRTFVIGVPGTESARGFLSALAYKGGTAQSDNCDHSAPSGSVGDCHFDLANETFKEQVSAALQEVSGEAIGCELSTGAGWNITQKDRDAINVQFRKRSSDTLTCLPRLSYDNCINRKTGWQFALNRDGSENYERIVLCGDACNVIKNNSGVQVDIVIGCPTLE
jgi:hypothetical protein